MSKLLLDSQPLVILPELACVVGLNEAVVLQQIHYWTETNRKAGKNERDGYYWTYNSFENWQKNFPWWSVRTIKTIFGSLEGKGLLVSANYNKAGFDRTKWYRIDYDLLNQSVPSCKICTMDSAKVAPPIPEINTETKPETKNAKGIIDQPPAVLDRPTYHFDKDIGEFITWYRTTLYSHYYGHDHPNLKADQLRRTHDALMAFRDEQSIGLEELADMARSFFTQVKNSDHNINHFVSGDMLSIRLYDAGYHEYHE